jgi:hypothetical protein
MSGALGRDLPAVGGCRSNNITDVIRAARQGNAGWLLIDQDIKCATFQIPVGILCGQEFNGHGTALRSSG